MKITLLGTGSVIPDPKSEGRALRSYTSILVELAGDTILLDIGPGTICKLLELGHDIRHKPDYLFFTHFHIDHCSDFPALIKSRHFDPATGNCQPQKLVKVFGPPKLLEFSEQLFNLVERWSYLGDSCDYRKVTEMTECAEGLVTETNNWRITCIPVTHYDGIAYRIDSDGKSFLFSGDMGYDENLVELGKDVDLAVIEAAFPSDETLIGNHLSPEDVGKLATKGNFSEVVLTHLYPQCAGKEEDMLRRFSQHSAAKVSIAQDMMSFDI